MGTSATCMRDDSKECKLEVRTATTGRVRGLGHFSGIALSLGKLALAERSGPIECAVSKLATRDVVRIARDAKLAASGSGAVTRLNSSSVCAFIALRSIRFTCGFNSCKGVRSKFIGGATAMAINRTSSAEGGCILHGLESGDKSIVDVVVTKRTP